jgi:hypothetical protein
LVSRVVLTAAETARQAQERETQVQALVEESERLMKTIYDTSNKNPAFQQLPEPERLEVYALAEELNDVLGQLKEEGQLL